MKSLAVEICSLHCEMAQLEIELQCNDNVR